MDSSSEVACTAPVKISRKDFQAALQSGKSNGICVQKEDVLQAIDGYISFGGRNQESNSGPGIC